MSEAFFSENGFSFPLVNSLFYECLFAVRQHVLDIECGWV